MVSGPRRKRTCAEERFGGPLAKINGERDAVAVVSAKDHDIFTVRMASENGAHAFREQYWPGPAVRDADGVQGRMQLADAALEPEETLRGFSFANVEAVQIRRGELL